MKMRRLWPSTRHPSPTQVQVSDSIMVASEQKLTVTGIGRRHDTVMASAIDEDGYSVILAWDDKARTWMVEPWSGIREEA